MTETLTKVIVDCSTGEETILPLTAEELAEREVAIAQAIIDKVALDAAEEAKTALKASAKAKLIAGTPLTAEEADTLII